MNEPTDEPTGEPERMSGQWTRWYLRDLHQPTQWTGWRLFLMRFAREPRAFMDHWCTNCHQEYPCDTINRLDGHIVL